MKLEVPIPCPQCKREHKRALDQLRPGAVIDCPCGAVITFSGDDMRKAQAALDQLTAALKKLGK